MAEMTKVGIISCSGEAIAAGTLARLASRRVLETLRPQSTVTLCLPLFLAGEETERRFARQHPTITVDGCDKLCAKKGTEQYSGAVQASLVVSEILGDRLASCHRSQRQLDAHDEQAVWLVAEHLAAAVDELTGTPAPEPSEPTAGNESGACSCGGKPGAEGLLNVDGTTVIVNGLRLIFEHLRAKGLKPGEDARERLLDTVQVYHPIEPGRRAAYGEALDAAYQSFCESAAKITNGS